MAGFTQKCLKRLLSGITAVVVTTAMLQGLPVIAEGNTTNSTYTGNGYKVNYNIKNSWDGNQNIEIALTNTGSEPLLNWALKYDAHGEIGGLWNGTVYKSDSTKYIVKNAGYNYEILPEQTVTFGYTLTGETLDLPDNIELCSQRTERNDNSYNVSMDITNDWDTGFSGTITVENLGETPLEAWQLSFDTNFVINDIWNAQITASEGNHYTVANDVTTTPINVGERKIFGFTAAKEMGVTPEISECSMTEITINSDFSAVDNPDNKDEELSIYAIGEYISDENAIGIEWYTNVENGSFEVMESYNNEEYITTTVLDNTYLYTYPIAEDFDVRYFKVVQTAEDGRTAESVPFLVTKTENGYNADFLDSDSDGLADIYEDMIGTDVNNSDTDGDGLTDYQEVYVTGTSPTKFDSVTEGVSDADADSDEDGLPNAKELELGTDPQNADSDEDGLSDSDEINVHGTDPLNSDTDNDGLPDGDEPHIGLDPINPETFGYPDAEYVSEQTIAATSETLANINTEENPYELTIKYTGTGYAEGNLTAGESGYVNAIGSDMQLGEIAEFSLENTCQMEKSVLYFTIKDAYIDNELGTYAQSNSELSGIKRLGVFTFNEEYNILVPVVTEYDIENNRLWAEVNTQGTYMLVDYEKWLDSWGVASTASSAVRIMSTDSCNTEAVDETKEIVFLLQSSGDTTYYYNIDTKLIRQLSQQLFNKFTNIKIYIVAYYNDKAVLLNNSYGSKALSSYGDVKYALSNTNYIEFLDFVDRNHGLNLVLNDSCLKNVDYVYEMHNAASISWGIYDFLDECSNKGIKYSEIKFADYIYADDSKKIRAIISKLDGIYRIIDTDNKSSYANTRNLMYKHITGYDYPSWNYISSLTLKNITLDNTLTNIDSVDTDADGLADWQEVDRDNNLITYEFGDIHLPTYEDCLRACGGTYLDFDKIMNVMKEKFGIVIEMQLFGKEILPLDSDPTMEDTDGDNIFDSEDANPLKKFDSNFIVVDSIEYEPHIDYLDKEIDLSELCYESQKYNVASRDRALLYEFLLSAGCAAGEIPLAQRILFPDIGEYESMPNASKMLIHYLGGSGETYYLSEQDISNIIFCDPHNTKHYFYNLQQMKRVSENIVCPGNTVTISTSPTCNFVGASFSGTCDNKCANIDFPSIIEPLYDLKHDYSYAIGDANCAIVAEVTTEDGIMYTATYRYYILDFYNWDWHSKKRDYEQHLLHERGMAKEYYVTGYFERDIIWFKGE